MTANFAHLTIVFGLLGNIVSFMVFLSPLPTFYKIYMKKSSEGFQSAPYVIGLFSAMLWIYYALLKTNTILLLTINCVGCFIQTFYICFFLYYAPKKTRMEGLKLITSLIVIGFGSIVVTTQFVASGINRVVIVGWICLVFSMCVFVAPLGVVRQVIKTKNVECMPILLSVALTFNAVTWFFYGILVGDLNIAIPNVLGFTFGVVQMMLYVAYKKKKPVNTETISMSEVKISEMEEQKISEPKDEKAFDNVKLHEALTCSDALPNIVEKLKEKKNDAVLVTVEPQILPNVSNHIIEVTV